MKKSVACFAVAIGIFSFTTNDSFGGNITGKDEPKVSVGEKKESKAGLSDKIKFHGRFHSGFFWNNNKGTASSLFNLDTSGNRYGNPKFTAIAVNFKADISDSINLIGKLAIKEKGISLSELNLRATLDKNFSISVGQLYLPFSMEADTSGNHMLTNDSTRFNFEPDADIKNVKYGTLFTINALGITGEYANDYFGLFGGVSGNTFNDDPYKIGRFIFSVKGRANPYRDGDNVVHFGANYFYEKRKIADSVLNDTDGKGKSSGILPVFASNKIGGEFAINYSWFNFQSEYRMAGATVGKFDDSSFREKIKNLNGFYTQVNLNLTGESLRYDNNGTFKSLKVRDPVGKGGFGAFGLTFRFAQSNFNRYSVEKPFDFGKHKEYTVALNWTPVNSLRFTLQYSRFEEDFELSKAVKLNKDKKTNRYDTVSLKCRLFF
ncbi:hypothetical protein FACS1894152_3590 [Bacilli bacterium]|nr:hypothetical protein FACS1894152_3590 [Bacilli bacterium]